MSGDSSAKWISHPWVAEGQARVRFGIVGGLSLDWQASIAWVQEVERLGFDSFWIADHPLHQPRDCWTSLAALAVTTSRIRLGTQVCCPYYRHPALLARQAADVDRLSAGRLVLGLGIGDLPGEFDQLGMEYPNVANRQSALEETVQIVNGLWAGDPYTLEGTHFRARAAHMRVGPIQQPRVPILIAGGGERVTLRQVARYADASNFGPANLAGSAWTVEDVARKCAALQRHCEALDRPYESVLRTHRAHLRLRADALRTDDRVRNDAIDYEYQRFVGTPADAVGRYQELAAAGIRYFMVVLDNDHETLQRLAAEVVPKVRDI